MSQACRRFWKCDKTLAFRSLSRRCAIPCSCHAKRHLNVQKWSEPLVFLTFWLRNVLRATTACTFSVSQLPKVVRSWCVLWSEHVVFCTFWLRHVLRGTTACTFSTSQLPKVVRTCGVLWILTSKCASCRKGVRFWTSQLPKVLQTCGIFLTFWLRHVLRATKACNFSSLISTDGSAPAALASLLFDPPEPQIIGKTQWIVTFLPFRAPSSSFFWLFLFSDLLSSTPLFSLLWRAGHFWHLKCRKSARRCGVQAHFEVKMSKHTSFGPLLEVEMSKKCTPLWREAYFQVKSAKNWRVRSTFGRSDVLSRGRRQGLCTLAKVSKTWGFCSMSKNAGRRGTFEEDLQRCISRGRRSTKDMFIRDVRRSGRWFPERGCILEPQIFRFAEMILRDRCSTSYDLASLFHGRRSSLDRWTGKIAKRIGTRLSALHSTFHFWRKSRRIDLFLMLSNSKNDEVSQTCFVSDVVKFKKWRRLAELFRFGRCYVQTLRNSRRISSFLTCR